MAPLLIKKANRVVARTWRYGIHNSQESLMLRRILEKLSQ
jgi:hypothetical protein